MDAQLEGIELKNRFVVGRLIDNGSNGEVYKAVKLKDPSLPLVIKFSKHTKEFQKEVGK